MGKVLSDDEMASLERQSQPKRVLSDDEMASLEAQSTPPPKDKYGMAANAISAAGRAALKGIGTVAHTVDKYTGAPVRAAVGAYQDDKPVGEAFVNQFLREPETAPTGKDIAAKAGVSTKEFNTPLIMNPFTMEKAKVSPAGIVGAGVEAATDPTTYLPGIGEAKLLEKGGQAVSKISPKVAEYLQNVAKERAVKAATGENAGALRKIARVKGQSGGDIDKAIGNIRTAGGHLLEDTEGGPAVGWLSKSSDIADAAAKKRAIYGQKIGDVGKTVDELVPGGAVVGKDLAQELRDYAQTIPNVGKGGSLRSRLEDEAENMKNLGQMSFAQAQKVKNQFPWEPQAADALISNKDVTNRIQGIVGNKMDEAAEAAKSAGPGPERSVGDRIPLDDEHTLVFDRSTPNRLMKTRPNDKSNDKWSIVKNVDGKDVQVGDFQVPVYKSDNFGDYATINKAMIDDENSRGKGLGTKVYKELSKHYGTIVSDANSTSDTAKRVWEKLGGKNLPPEFEGPEGDLLKNAAGDDRKHVRLQDPTPEQLQALDQYGPAKERYGTFKNVADAGTEQQMRTLNRRFISPSDYGMGAVGAMMGAGHGPGAAILGAGAALANKLARERGSAFAARTADAISKKIMAAPEQFQKWLPTMQQAAKRGNEAVVVAHHMLLNNDPSYAAQFQDKGEE